MSYVSPHSFGSSAAARFAGTAGGGPPGFEKDLEAALKEAGVEESKIPDLLSQIQSAVSTASQGQSPSSRDSVRTAVESVLKENGVDVEKFDSAMRKQRESRMAVGPASPDLESKKTNLLSALADVGVDSEKSGEVAEEILQLVAEKLNSARESGGKADLRDSVNSVLASFGIDAEEFHAAMNSRMSTRGNLLDESV